MVTPRIFGPIADSFMIARGEGENTEYLTPKRTWDKNIFEGARFELDEIEKRDWWLDRELQKELNQ